MKWRILDQERANLYKLQLLDVGDNILLSFNIKYIPKGMSEDEFIKFIQDEGIAILDKDSDNNMQDNT